MRWVPAIPHLDDGDFAYLRDLVYKTSRISLGERKRTLVCTRLLKRLRNLQLATFAEYRRLLESPQGAGEVTEMVNAISTNCTSFFREPLHFQFVQQTVLALFRERLAHNGQASLRVWSAACSSGEEPYSVALLLAQDASLAQAAWEIEATDISTRMIAHGREGIYASQAIRHVPPAMRRHFTPVGDHLSFFQIDAAIRRRVRFQSANLFHLPAGSRPPFHLIFCRNVMIYFDAPTRQVLVNLLAASLHPGGYLITGHSETLIGVQHHLRRIQPSIFQRPPAKP